MLVELGLVEQRYKAVLEVLDGATVTDVALRNGVVRQTVHDWVRRYANHGLAGLADRSSKPDSCPHQMSPVVEARIVELRRAHPAWGQRTILFHLAKEKVEPLPALSSVYRCLVRHQLVEPTKRKRRREDYKRWERSRAMELWQMDVVGRFHLRDGTDLSAVTGVDDHSRFCVCCRLVARATAKPVCDALFLAMGAHGVPDQVLTDNGKVFTARFGPGPGPVLFDRICNENGVRHLLTAPYSPTTTGKVERFHRTLRAEFFGPNDYTFATIVEAQAALDAWVIGYNTERPHQSIGMVPPIERFKLAADRLAAVDTTADDEPPTPVADASRPAGVIRWVDARGNVSVGKFPYKAGRVFAGEPVEVVCQRGLVELVYKGTLIATHAERRRPDAPSAGETLQAPRERRARDATTGPAVKRIADSAGIVSFAGAAYRAGRAWAGKQITVAIVAGSVQLSVDSKVIRVHPIRHDRSKEHGAFATPNGRPRKATTG
ncbi:MAG: IS481 family transposase [Actinomycetota bacterium]|nr:IS481 family transposase [Actinomycetota bacterium]